MRVRLNTKSTRVRLNDSTPQTPQFEEAVTPASTLVREYQAFVRKYRALHHDKFKPLQPTEEQRAFVAELAAYGVPKNDIARLLNVSLSALINHFNDELHHGSTFANTKVAAVAYFLASSGVDPESTWKWLARRAGWKETTRIEHEHTFGEMTREELEQELEVRRARRALANNVSSEILH